MRKIIFCTVLILASCVKPYNKGLKHFQEKNYHEAIKYFTKVIDKDSLNGNALAYRGQAYSSIGKYDLAIKDLELAVNNGRHDVETYNELGHALYKTNQVLDAVNCFYIARLINKNDQKTYFNLGIGLADLKEYDKAIQSFNQYLSMTDDHVGYYARGTTYFYMDELNKALNDLNRAIELEKTNADYFIKRGAIFAAMQEYDSALNDFETAIELESFNSEAYHCKALVYEEINDSVKACEQLYKAKSISPELQYKLNINCPK